MICLLTLVGYQFCITIGILLANCVVYATQNRRDTGSYRIPIAVQFLWAIILAIGLALLPESPRYWVKKGKLDKALITSNDLLTLDAADVAKRAQLPAAEVRKLADAVIAALHHQLGFGGEEAVGNSFLSASGNPDTTEHGWTCISTLDQELDAALGGGIPRGYLVEVTGERYVSMGYCLTRLY